MEVALAVGGSFLSAFLQVAFDRIASTRKFIDFFEGENVIKFDDEVLDRLEITLNTISVVLEDAEAKQAKSPAVRRWLDSLKHSVNLADDLLDELNTECLRLKLDCELQQQQSVADLKLDLKATVIDQLIPNLKKVTERLEYFVNQIHGLGLKKFDPYLPPSSPVSVCDLLSPSLGVAIDRISKSHTFIEFLKGKKGIKFDEEVLDRLTLALYKISEVLEDAQVKEGAEAVKTWLGKVRAEVNYADDLLDEFNTDCLRLQLDKQTQVDLKSSFKSAFINLKFSSKPSFIKKLMPKLKKVTATLEDFVKEIKELGLQKLDPKMKYPYPSPTTSLVDKSQIFGRDDEKEKLVERVLSDGGASNVSVIAITGMGGIGKTTLAQLVYNDDRVKKKFSTRAWVCVSEEYDAIVVTKALLKEVSSAVVDDKDEFNHHQVKLKENLEGKCFLIILDDIWNENSNDWSNLKTPLNYGSRGSKVIVTTRNETVARMMQNEPFHHLHPIPQDQSWCLFKSHAFDCGHHTPSEEFETIGTDIVKKCNGLPLAIKTVAGALRPERDINVWHDFLSSEIWSNMGDILPALSLSYKHLPSQLKCCFAFCALFPKDVPFEKDEVVLLWMTNDLVKPSTQKVGRVYFEELKSRSFFESVNGKKYLIHDLINDLARSVAGNTCIRLEDYQAADHHHSIQRENEFPPELLHLSYLSTYRGDTAERFNGLAQAQSLRTFLPIHRYRWQLHLEALFFPDILPKLQRLRALDLSQYDISVVPDSIGDLKHLRFLNLASTLIEKLPNAICKCLNLQTLILANCKELVELPEDMRLLINLQHLDVRGVGEPLIKTMATWLRMFKDIPNISIVVDKIYGNVLEHLDKFQLYDSLNIIGLGDTDIVTTEGAKREELKDKSCIEGLTLEWGGVVKSPEDEFNMFVKLQPHTNIKQLSVEGYKGTRFPDWLGDSAFSNLESLSLEDCKNCFCLPPLGQLSALKKLDISGMDGISEIGEEFYGDAFTSKPFQALRELEFNDMAEWAIWNTHSSVVFPSLKYLKILNCYNILSFPEGGLAAPNLERLDVYKCKKMKSLPARMHTQLPLLTELYIMSCPKIECFPEGGLPSSLEILGIRDCSKMRIRATDWGLQTLPYLKTVYLSGLEDKIFPEEGLLPTSLQELFIEDFGNLESLNEEGLQHLCSLQTLSIDCCLNLKYLPQQKFSSSLSHLSIISCELVESFPEGLASSLSQLHIINCPKLAGRIEREKGEDWPKVFHIPNIHIDGERIS